jgi:hypothetical protein
MPSFPGHLGAPMNPGHSTTENTWLGTSLQGVSMFPTKEPSKKTWFFFFFFFFFFLLEIHETWKSGVKKSQRGSAEKVGTQGLRRSLVCQHYYPGVLQRRPGHFVVRYRDMDHRRAWVDCDGVVHRGRGRVREITQSAEGVKGWVGISGLWASAVWWISVLVWVWMILGKQILAEEIDEVNSWVITTVMVSEHLLLCQILCYLPFRVISTQQPYEISTVITFCTSQSLMQ